MMQRTGAFLVAALLALLLAGPAGAQTKADVPERLTPLLEQAEKDGMAVIVIAPSEARAQAEAASADAGMTDLGVRLREEIRRLIVTSPDMPRRVAAAFEAIGGGGRANWLALAVLTALAGILLGYVVRRFIGMWGREYFRYMWNPSPRDDAERIGYLLFRALLQTVYTAVLFGVAMLVAIAFDTGHEPSRATVFIIVSAYCAWRMMREVVGFNLLAPDVPSHRMLNLSDSDAKAIFRDMQWVFALAIAVLAFSAWIGRLELDADANKLLLILASFIAAGVIGYMTVKHRRAVAGAILGAGRARDKSWWRRVLAGGWHVVALVYLLVATAASIGRLLLGLPSANILISAPAAALLAGIGAYGVLYLLIEHFFRLRRIAFDRKLRAAIHADLEQHLQEDAAHREALERGIPEGEEEVENLAEEGDRGRALPQYKPLFRPLALHAAGVAVTIASIGIVLSAWGVGVAERGNPVAAFMDTLTIVFVAWVLYRAIAVYVEAKLADEAGASAAAPEIGEEPGGHGTSRLGTLLPLTRNVLSATIVVIAGMIVLSNLGVDIAPLFAGAGVIGLAVGFGAQTLIRDIFSGGFFLVDDAFRKGEYVELGDIRGTVEKISLRSFQLRHHNGPLHTIPFGEIKQLTNYSRDWVIMKLPLRLTFDTDVEKVRKLIKKLGQQLLQHPDIGRNFLQPLKSQGVVEMDDSAMILRVKFMTKPGDQWMTRKAVYAAIQELFRREGIRFANKEVTVRIADRPDTPATPAAVEAAAAAAARLLDEQAAPASAKPADDR